MPTHPHIIIVGPGAMGCLHAALLAEAGLRVTLLDHRAERAARLAHDGLSLEMPDGSTRTVAVPATAQAESVGSADLVLLFTKAYDTEGAIRHAAPVIGDDTSVLTLQNGLGNYEILQRHVLPAQVLAGVTSSGATLLGVGRIRVAGIGAIALGSPVGNRERAEAAAGLFRQADLTAQVTDNVDAALWRKAIINAAINPLGALTGRRNGELLQHPPLRRLLGRVAQEAHQVALAARQPLADLDPVATVEEVCQATAANQCSMLQDVLAGRRTEIEQINGEIVQRGKATSLPTPLNEALVALIKGVS